MTSRSIYRQGLETDRLSSFIVTVKETDLWIAVSSECYNAALPQKTERYVNRLRTQLEAYIKENPSFAASLKPVIVNHAASPLILEMVRAANLAGVGPMAAVAGLFAQHVGLFLMQFAPEVIVENGGDLFLAVNEPALVGIFAGESPLSGKLAIRLRPEQTPLGICTSSGTIGPSYSQGQADAAIVLARSAPLADAAATALGNRVRTAADLEDALAYARKIEGLSGALLIIGDQIAAWGELELIKTAVLRKGENS